MSFLHCTVTEIHEKNRKLTSSFLVERILLFAPLVFFSQAINCTAMSVGGARSLGNLEHGLHRVQATGDIYINVAVGGL